MHHWHCNRLCCTNEINSILAGALQDFGSSSGKSGIRQFFRNLAKSGSGQISSQICRIWQMPVQLQYVQLITDKTNAADLSSGVFAILTSIKFIAIPQILSKTGKQWHNKGSTELYCHFISADTDSIVDTISFIRHIVLWFKTSSHQIKIGRIWVPKSGQVWLWPNLK